MNFEVIWETAARAVLVYAVLLFVVRILGKREVGGATAFDFIVALILGEVTDEIIFGNVTLFQGFAAVGAVGLLHLANSWGSFSSRLISRVIESEPTVVVRDGQIVKSGLVKERMSEEELRFELRLREIEDLAEVKLATVEPNGQVSALKQEWARNLQKSDLKKS